MITMPETVRLSLIYGFWVVVDESFKRDVAAGSNQKRRIEKRQLNH